MRKERQQITKKYMGRRNVFRRCSSIRQEKVRVQPEHCWIDCVGPNESRVLSFFFPCQNLFFIFCWWKSFVCPWLNAYRTASDYQVSVLVKISTSDRRQLLIGYFVYYIKSWKMQTPSTDFDDNWTNSTHQKKNQANNNVRSDYVL